MTTLRTLLNGIVDYAGLFPPASLSMTEAVKNYARYLQSPDRWALARFIVPVSRLEEFAAAVHALPPDFKNQTWRLAALVGSAIDDEIKIISDFNQRFSRAPRSLLIDALELKATSVDEIERLSIPNSLSVFVEISIAPLREELLDVIKRKGFRAKARTGGVASDAFPTPSELARFIFHCAKRQTPFKATAGLHHPIRAAYRLTYEPNSPSGVMFGFLNVFLAGAFAFSGMNEKDLADLLSETDVKQFCFSDDSAHWRNHRIERSALEEARARFALSFGSCSFEEPIDDLKKLHLLDE